MTDSYAAMKAILNPDPSPQMQALFAPRHGIRFREPVFRWTLGQLSYPAVMDEAVLWLDAANSVSGEQAAVNQGTGGTALNARYGSTSGSDTNDPLLLTHTGENYVYLPGAASNNLADTTFTPADLSGDFSVMARIKPTAWTSEASLVTNFFSDFDLRIVAGGALALVVLETPAAERKATASSVPYSLNSTFWVKATWDRSAGQTSFYWAADQATEPTSWTLISTNANSGWGGTTLRDEVAVRPHVGARNGGTLPFTGVVHRAIVRDTADTDVFDFNAATDITDAGATSFTATSGQTVTVNRATSGRKTALVTRPIWLFGTDDYLEVADNALLNFGASDGFTVMCVLRLWATYTNRAIVEKQLGNNGVTMQGYGIGTNTITAWSNRFGDGTNRQVASDGMASTAGALQAVAMVRDVDADEHYSLVNNTKGPVATDTTTGTLATAQPLRIGAYTDPTGSFADMECVAVAIWRRVLTADEIAAINTYYGTA